MSDGEEKFSGIVYAAIAVSAVAMGFGIAFVAGFFLGHFTGDVPESRSVAISENWGFASFETDRYRLVVDEDRFMACQLFDLLADPADDHNVVANSDHAAALDELMTTLAKPFLAIAPQRPHPSPFA